MSRIDSISGPGGNISVPVGAGTTTNLEGFIGMLAGNYSVLQQPGARADLLAGVRYAWLKTALRWEFAGPAGALGTSGLPKRAHRSPTASSARAAPSISPASGSFH